MKDKSAFLEPLLDKVEEYGIASFSLMKYKALDKAADVSSTVASRSMALIAGFIFILTVSIGVALWVGDLLGQTWYGFVCIAGFYGVLGFVLFFLSHKWVKKCVSNSIVSKILN